MNNSDGTTTVLTKNCLICGDGGVVEVPTDGYNKWRAGMFLQDAMPDVPSATREQLLTGTHGPCWDNAFKEYDEAAEEEEQGIVIRDRNA